MAQRPKVNYETTYFFFVTKWNFFVFENNFFLFENTCFFFSTRLQRTWTCSQAIISIFSLVNRPTRACAVDIRKQEITHFVSSIQLKHLCLSGFLLRYYFQTHKHHTTTIQIFKLFFLFQFFFSCKFFSFFLWFSKFLNFKFFCQNDGR